MAGGTGSRLFPLTKVTNKHLLPIYNKPMIYYPIETLVNAGIRDIMIVSGKGHAGHFLELLKSGHDFSARFSYGVQEEAGGIAQALGICEDFSDHEDVMVMLGDNLIEESVKDAVDDFKNQKKGAKVFLKEVEDPRSFGVAEIEGDKIKTIEEKPENPKTNQAVIGLYIYDAQVWDVIKNLKPSGRGELEITDVNNYYADKGELTYKKLEGWWGDGGESFASYLKACNLAAEREKTEH